MTDVSLEGPQGVRPGREAVGAAQMNEQKAARRFRRGGGEQPVVDEAEFRSYYGVPVINTPVWQASDIAGYLFLGGLAGASSVVAAAAQLSGRPALARAGKVTSTVAAGLSGAALVHDLGRPGRFLNMLRVLKPSSPMSVGSWLLASYAPMSAAASFSAVTGRMRLIGALGTAGAAALGPGVATYTAALISNTAVPAWHEGYRLMPFLFAASASSAAAGLGLAVAPLHETTPVRRLGIAAGTAELALLQVMKHSMGEAGEAFSESERGRRYERAAAAVTAAGVGVAGVAGRRSRLASVVAGTALLAGSALTRFAIFEAGVTSAENPRYTIVPQRRRLARRQPGVGGGEAAGTAPKL
jgi:formate-dependent nitrite reductase membrane component NrfD